MEHSLYQQLLEDKKNGKKKFAVLIDPDKLRLNKVEDIVKVSIESHVDYFFIGGSLVVDDMLDHCLLEIKKSCNIPLVLFPGSSFQLSYKADAILFLSLISGRNPELLIGKHVVTAPFLKMSPLEIISTGYMLIDGGVPTSVSYISNTNPIPASKSDIAACTALAGEMLGLKMIYLDAGSGALNPVPTHMISTVSQTVNIPLIVGGGIQTPERAQANVEAGADLIVVGNAIEKNLDLIPELSLAVHARNSILETN